MSGGALRWVPWRSTLEFLRQNRVYDVRSHSADSSLFLLIANFSRPSPSLRPENKSLKSARSARSAKPLPFRQYPENLISMPQKVVIIGGGIVGVSTAYYLSHHESNPFVTLIEASSIASGASGKAGGLLALDWHGNDTASLARLSYQLHASLAEQFNGRERWGYRELTTLEISCTEGKAPSRHVAGVPDWLREGVISKVGNLGTTQSTAQVHPRRFCEAIVKESKNLEVIMGHASKVVLYDNKKVKGVEVEFDGIRETKIIEADVVVVAAGPWTSRLLPNIPVSTQRAHSITISTQTPVSPHALFTNIKLKNGSLATPEIYPRTDEIYACGDVDKLAPLPKFARDVKVDEGRCRQIMKNISVVSEILAYGEITAMQACYLPYSEIGPGPSVGWVPGMRNVAVAAGHSCWGICNAPGTGKLLTELICEGRISSANIQSLDPGRYTR
ncbi:hypothetical protein TWF106_009511 [Orbilia oligospora]|uniref:FAD dependent oxidoreductase domain-containing protein n=1 Tax=Orbilia oligospora TaxID=2813651 RepID=A0A7C8QL60_ORBOL|nr:hypothetical protein TWF106_009511 [Orbilia oligospora]